ncbi:MAG: DUF4364 family protein [Clostridia bacterium]|nr:DUF4364 family protein [Clostridia bacterium]
MQQGYVREPEDIKCLILYCLSLLPITVREEDLLEIVMIDDGFGYFEFAQYFRELIDARMISEIGVGGRKEYLLTPKGKSVLDLMEGHLRASVCDKAQAAAIRVVRRIRRSDSIRTAHRANGDGTFTTTMTICDKSTELASVSMLVYSERQCRILEENFKNNAENVFKGLVNLLLEGDKKQDPED